MALIYLLDILKRNGLISERVKLIRHSLKDKEFLQSVIKMGLWEEYQKIQKQIFFNN